MGLENFPCINCIVIIVFILAQFEKMWSLSRYCFIVKYGRIRCHWSKVVAIVKMLEVTRSWKTLEPSQSCGWRLFFFNSVFQLLITVITTFSGKGDVYRELQGFWTLTFIEGCLLQNLASAGKGCKLVLWIVFFDRQSRRSWLCAWQSCVLSETCSVKGCVLGKKTQFIPGFGWFHHLIWKGFGTCLMVSNQEMRVFELQLTSREEAPWPRCVWYWLLSWVVPINMINN